MVVRNWLSVRVDLVSGRGLDLWPRPGRVFAAARTHTFAQLARAVDVAFARWDLAHLHVFTLADGTRVTALDEWDDAPEGALDGRTTRLGRLQPGERFAYVFDLGDDWAHLCTVGTERIDPVEELGMVPDLPTPFWGWGDLPDQYGRGWEDDDGEEAEPEPPSPLFGDLPPILPWWGPPRGQG